MGFFSDLFGKKTNKNKPSETPLKKPKLSDEEKASLEEKVTQLNNQVDDASFTGSNSNEFNKNKADTLDKLGATYKKLGEWDKAIKSYEKSLEFNKDFGPAFDALQDLYNKKRMEASYAKDNDGIQKWLNKSDKLNNLSKKIMRSK